MPFFCSPSTSSLFGVYQNYKHTIKFGRDLLIVDIRNIKVNISTVLTKLSGDSGDVLIHSTLKL